jgi:hypothetical protein
MGDFFLTLPSNASSDTFPDNKIYRYTTQLPRAIDFGKYKAALVEFEHPGAWLNVTEACIVVVKFPAGLTKTGRLPTGKYQTIHTLISAIHKEFEKMGVIDKIRIIWDEVTMRTTIAILDQGFSLEMSPTLLRILGYRRGMFHQSIRTGDRCADIDEGMTSLFVYSPTVQNQMVGDTMAPLLRVVPLKSQPGTKNVNHEFRHPRYLPLVEETTDVITIDIRRDDGRHVPFLNGKVIATLHFVPK